MSKVPPSLQSRVPRVKGDSSLRFLADGYLFGHRRFERLRTDLFRTHLLGRPVTVMRGVDAARFFYEGGRFDRTGAMPTSVLHSLQDEGSVQTLTGARHGARKSMFTRILNRGGDAALARCFDEVWTEQQAEWKTHEQISLLPALERMLTVVALRWLDIEEPIEQQLELSHQFGTMIDGAGSFGPRNWHGRYVRLWTERWARRVIARERKRQHPENSPLAVLLAEPSIPDDHTAAIELLNLIRPIVAVSRFISFAALALHQHPQYRDRLRDDAAFARAFAQEVRRTTPFFPVVGGRAAVACEWHGIGFEPGDWVVLDLFATNRHPDLWRDAGRFDPTRFVDDSAREDAVVAQGAGPIAQTHRCPGEPATVDLLAAAATRMASEDWTVPHQNLRVDLTRIPARIGPGGMRVRVH